MLKRERERERRGSGGKVIHLPEVPACCNHSGSLSAFCDPPGQIDNDARLMTSIWLPGQRITRPRARGWVVGG